MAINEENYVCKKTSESPGCSSSLIGQKNIFFWPIRSGQFKHFWNWFGKSKCPGARLDITVNFHHGHFIDPPNCPWVSEDGVTFDTMQIYKGGSNVEFYNRMCKS